MATVLVSSACVTESTTECRPPMDGTHSVARMWNEALLDAIRRDFPAPTVHARNLFHLSAAMWDAWAAYDPAASGYFVSEKQVSDQPSAARSEAISYAAYRVLRSRYANAAGVVETTAQLDSLMEALCFPIEFVDVDGDTPAALGNRIAAAVLEYGAHDGSNETDGYEGDYEPVNPPLVFDEPAIDLSDPNRWQPLAFDQAFAQNGLPIAAGVQSFVGPHWGHVSPFALEPSSDGLPIDPGPPPMLGDPATDSEFKRAVVEVIAASQTLDPTDGVIIDIGPGAIGDNELGSNDGTGHAVNPSTGLPYPPNRVLRADYGRVIAEFWADGPESETPPGHWNTLANAVSDHPQLERRIDGRGPELDRLEWDVKLYFVLNGALHDAAVAAWGSKAHYDYVRPISMIRYLGGNGQSTDTERPSYDRQGLPLVSGSIEVITAESASSGGRHAHLADHIGEIAIDTWRGPPDDEHELAGVGWIRAVEWLPYQRQTFVTPSFPGYVSGHSAFSRAAAEVLTAFTGDPYFPGGVGEWVVEAGGLEFEAGPAEDVTLQWATYRDAADEAGISRIFGGIHVSADDRAGRIMGASCGWGAWELAQRYWTGTATEVSAGT